MKDEERGKIAQLKKEQRAFLALRNQCVNQRCVKLIYGYRLAELIRTLP
jgi:uncharacterized protein